MGNVDVHPGAALSSVVVRAPVVVLARTLDAELCGALLGLLNLGVDAHVVVGSAAEVDRAPAFLFSLVHWVDDRHVLAARWTGLGPAPGDGESAGGISLWDRATYFALTCNWKHAWVVDEGVWWTAPHALARVLARHDADTPSAAADLVASYTRAPVLPADLTRSGQPHERVDDESSAAASATPTSVNAVCRVSRRLLERLADHAATHGGLAPHETLLPSLADRLPLSRARLSGASVVLRPGPGMDAPEVRALVAGGRHVLYPVPRSVARAVTGDSEAHALADALAGDAAALDAGTGAPAADRIASQTPVLPAYIVNLDARRDRWARAETAWSRVRGVRVRRVSAVPHYPLRGATDGSRGNGCTATHIDLLERLVTGRSTLVAALAGVQPSGLAPEGEGESPRDTTRGYDESGDGDRGGGVALVLEDDATVEPVLERYLPGLLAWARAWPDAWDVINLGPSTLIDETTSALTPGPDVLRFALPDDALGRSLPLLRVSIASACHAYLVNTRSARLATALPLIAAQSLHEPVTSEAGAIDVWLWRWPSLLKVAVAAPVALQAPGYSDLVGKAANYTLPMLLTAESLATIRAQLLSAFAKARDGVPAHLSHCSGFACGPVLTTDLRFTNKGESWAAAIQWAATIA